MPSYYRGSSMVHEEGEDAKRLWRYIDETTMLRPFKRQRTSCWEGEEEVTYCMEEDDDDEHSIESLLRNSCLDQLWEEVNHKNARIELLEMGGHWTLMDLLLTACSEEEDTGMSDSDNDSNDNDRRLFVVLWSCRILRELLQDDDHTTVRYQVYCAGGLDAVVKALETFPSNFDVRLEGCQFLSGMVSGSATTTTTTTTILRNLYQSTNGLRTILAPMDRTAIDKNNVSNNNSSSINNTRVWQLFFVVTRIVRSYLHHVPTLRCELLHTVTHNNFGFGKHMYDHLRTILDDEGDYSDAAYEYNHAMATE